MFKLPQIWTSGSPRDLAPEFLDVLLLVFECFFVLEHDMPLAHTVPCPKCGISYFADELWLL